MKNQKQIGIFAIFFVLFLSILFLSKSVSSGSEQNVINCFDNPNADLDLDGSVGFNDLVELLGQWNNTNTLYNGDVDGNGDVAFDDLIIVLGLWGNENLPLLEADINQDGQVNLYDLIIVLGSWASPPPLFTADIDNSGQIDFNDLILLLGSWGPAPFCSQCSDGIDNDGDGKTDWGYTILNDLYCSNPFDNSENNVAPDEIDWNQFPNFHIHPRFSVYYQGYDTYAEGLVPLQKGFTHITPYVLESEFRALVPPEKRAILWTGISGPDDEGYLWNDFKSPWGFSFENDMVPHWQNYMNGYAHIYNDPGDIPNADILVADIEAKWESDAKILELRGEDFIPEDLTNVNDGDFIEAYQQDMAALYFNTVNFPRSLGFNGKMGSYQDVPVPRKFWEIPDYTWEDWISDFSIVNYLFFDFEDPSSNWDDHFGPFRDTLEVYNPSVYISKNYPDSREEDPMQWIKGGRYLAYFLFNVDVNHAWLPDKELIVFEWLLFQGFTPNPWGRIIRGHMAHSLAIFSFFSHLDGVWLWDNVGESEFWEGISPETQATNRHKIYEHYLYGLYRLSRFNDMFEGNYEIYSPENPRDQYLNKLPIWRGIVNNGKMLVAAHNPFAEKNEVTPFTIEYEGNFITTIYVPGHNTFLGIVALP